MRTGRGSLAFAAAVVAACAALPLAGALSGGRVVFWRDVQMVWLPQVEVWVHSLAEGAWPTWDRFSGFGRPLLADPRAALFYPPTWINLIVPPGPAYVWLSVFHLWLGGLGALWLAKRLGASSQAALLAGAAFTASGPFLALVLMWHHLAGAAWMPWVLGSLDAVAETPSGRRFALAATAVAVQAFSGSPDYSAFTLLGAIPLVFSRIRPRLIGAGSEEAVVSRGRVGGPLLRLAPALASGAAAAAGLALAAVQWWPAALYASRGARNAGAAGAAVWSLAPAALLEVLAPFRFWDLPLTPLGASSLLESREPWLHSIHLGAPLLALALAGLASASRARAALATALAGGLLWSLGSHTPFLEAVQTLLPPLASLRFPVKAMVPVALTISLLAALGLDALGREGPRGDSRARAAGLGFVGLTLLALFFLSSPALGPSLDDPAARWSLVRAGAIALFLAALAAGLAWFSPRPRARWALAGLAVLVPLAQHRNLIETAPARLFHLRPELLSHLDPHATGRLYAYDALIVNEWQRTTSPTAPEALRVARLPTGFGPRAALVAGVREQLHPPTAGLWGLAGSFDYDVLDFEPRERVELATRLRASEASPAHLALLRLGAVTHATSLGPGTWWRGLRLVAQVPGTLRHPVTLLAVPDPLPRVYAVGRVRPARGGAALSALVARDFDPRRQVVLSPEDAESTGLPGSRPSAITGSVAAAEPLESEVKLTELKADRVEIEARLSRAGLVVLVDAWDPGWTALVDEQPAPVLRANVAFRAIPVPAGTHRISMRYLPSGLLAGAALSTLSALGLAAIALRTRLRPGAAMFPQASGRARSSGAGSREPR